MIPFPFRSFVLYCVLFSILFTGPTAGDQHRPDSRWIKPGALDRWGQQQRLRTQATEGEACEAQTEPLQCDCPSVSPEPTTCSADISDDHRLALVFYRKLIKTLFARDTLEVDETAGEQDYYTADLQLNISTRQLDKLLDDSCSAREINLIVSAVLEKATNTRRRAIFRENQCERLYNFLMQCFESKVVHNLLPVGLLIGVCLLVRIVARITRMNSFVVLLLLVFSITFCNKWKECNESLARQSLQNLETPPTSTFWTFLVGSAGTRSDGDPLPICDPLHVLVQSTVSIQAVYFKSIFKELLDAFNESTRGAGWFQTTITGLLLLGFTYMVLTSLVTVGISSGFQMVGNVVSAGIQASRNRAANDGQHQLQQQQQQQLPALNLNFHIGEGIARTVPLTELLRQESQRIEIVSEERPAIEGSSGQTDTKADDVPATTTTASDNAEESNDEMLAKNQTNEEK